MECFIQHAIFLISHCLPPFLLICTFLDLFVFKMANPNGIKAKPGRRLLPVIVDERDPKQIFARVPKSSTTLRDGLINITYGEFARAINRAAGWLEDKFGRSTSFDTLAYIGPSDIRYGIFFLAATKLGYKVSKKYHLLPWSA